MDRISVSEYRRFLQHKPRKRKKTTIVGDGLLVETEKRGNKYHAKQCEYNGIKFPSEKERDRFVFLEHCEKHGVIKNLRRQVRYELFPDEYEDVVIHLKTKDKTVRKKVYEGVHYTADFVYEKDGVEIVEDLKGSKDVVSRDFMLRIKMMHYLKGINVKIVTSITEAV